MVWDTDLTYKYFRLTGDGRLLIGGGTLRTCIPVASNTDLNKWCDC